MKSQSQKINEILDREIAILNKRLDEKNYSAYQHYRLSQLISNWESKKRFFEHLKVLYNQGQLTYDPKIQDFVGLDIELGLKKMLECEEIADTGYFLYFRNNPTCLAIKEIIALLFKELIETLPNESVFPSNLLGIVSHVSCWVVSPFQDIVYQNPHGNSSNTPDTAIYCIHGTADRCNAFSMIIHQFLHQWPESISVIHLVSFDERLRGRGIEAFSSQLKEKTTQHGHNKVIFLAHSRGGLVAAHFAHVLNEKSDTEKVEVKGIITIGTPFDGATMAKPPFSLLSRSVAQMTENSSFLKELQPKINESTIPYYCFGASRDLIVSKESALLLSKKEACTRFLLETDGHLSMLQSPVVANKISEIIKKMHVDVRPERALSP